MQSIFCKTCIGLELTLTLAHAFALALAFTIAGRLPLTFSF